MSSEEIVIRTDALTRDFKSTRAVDGLDISVPRGAIYGFLGPNGSGKTTTIRMLLGLLEPTAGKANVLGFDVQLKPDDVRRGAAAHYWSTTVCMSVFRRKTILSFTDALHKFRRPIARPASKRFCNLSVCGIAGKTPPVPGAGA